MSLDESWEQSGLVGKMAAGRYLIVSELAADGRRTLYEAENVELGKRVSLGVVRSGASTTAEQRLRDGAKLCSLNEPGLVAVLDVGKLDSGDLFVASELPNGTSLRTLTTGSLLEQPRVLAITGQLLEALAAAHAVGAIHGDVKPESIMLTKELLGERVKLLEVGVATLAGAAKGGDPRYSAPECALGSIDARADVYAVGAVLFELLTGHPPFFAADPTALRRLHAYAPTQTLQQRAPHLAFVPELEELVARALEKKREARFQTAAEMLSALDRAARAVEAALPRPRAPEPRKRSDSLLILAQDLMPATAKDEDANLPLIPVNVGRLVQPLPWWMVAVKRVRRIVDRADRRQRVIAVSLSSVVVLAVVILFARGGHHDAKAATTDVAHHANALTEQGKPAQAIQSSEREVAAPPDTVEPAGIADPIDRVAGLSRDLDQAKTCKQRRVIIGKLGASRDETALVPLEQARRQKCGAREATAAIRKIQRATR